MAIIILCLSLLLGGCGGSTEARLYARQEELAASDLSFSAELCSLGDGQLWAFSAAVEAKGEEGSMSLSAPSLLQGVRLRWGRGVTMEYEDVVMALPDLNEEGLSPASVLPLFCEVLQRGWLLRYRQDREGITAFYGLDNENELAVRYDEALVPQFLEYYVGGERRMWAEITDFNIGER